MSTSRLREAGGHNPFRASYIRTRGEVSNAGSIWSSKKWSKNMEKFIWMWKAGESMERVAYDDIPKILDVGYRVKPHNLL